MCIRDRRKGCDLKDVEGFSRVAGGAPANVAGAVAKLGVPAMVLTQLGKDAFGDHIIESLKESGIDTSHILQTSAYDTSLSFVSLREDGNRDFKFYRRTAADLQYGPENIHEHLLDDCGLVHFCSVSLVDSPMKQAHRALLELCLLYTSSQPAFLRIDVRHQIGLFQRLFIPLRHIGVGIDPCQPLLFQKAAAMVRRL